MKRSFLAVMVLAGLAACTSGEQKMLDALKPVDPFIHENKIDVNQIPDSFANPLHNFAISYPSNPKAESYLYAATLLSEKAGRKFDCAKWCETYITNYPKGKFYKGALMAAAINFEQCGTLDKAVKYYEQIAKQYPNSYEGKSAAQTAMFLKKGLITPEEQFNYLQKMRDSSAK